MLTPEQKKLLAQQAESEVRLSWGDADPTRLGQLISNVKARIADSALSMPNFTDYVTATVREVHAEKTLERDAKLDALLDHEKELKACLMEIYGKQGPEGVVSFANDHKIELSDCKALLEAEGVGFEQAPDLEIGD